MFVEKGTVIKESVDARKVKIENEKAWELLKEASEIVVGRGKKYLSFKPTAENKSDILSNCLGRTGNLRAPALKIGKRFIIGFNEDMYATYLG